MSTLQLRSNINHLMRFSTMYQHQIYIGTNVTPAFLFYIKCPEAFVSLCSKAEFLKAHFSINIIDGVEKDPSQSHCTVSGPGGWTRGIRLLLHKAGRLQCKQLPGCST